MFFRFILLIIYEIKNVLTRLKPPYLSKKSSIKYRWTPPGGQKRKVQFSSLLFLHNPFCIGQIRASISFNFAVRYALFSKTNFSGKTEPIIFCFISVFFVFSIYGGLRANQDSDQSFHHTSQVLHDIIFHHGSICLIRFQFHFLAFSSRKFSI